MPARFRASLLTALVVVATASAAHPDDPVLFGAWTLNHELTREAQPEDPTLPDVLGNLPRTSISVGGVPLPMPGNSPPPAPGSSLDPRILNSASLAIEERGDEITLVYDGGRNETLKRGNDQGLISRWSERKLTSRYETTSRKVSQVYEVRRDGRLLVTVKLNPNRGPTLVQKRVFDPVD